MEIDNRQYEKLLKEAEALLLAAKALHEKIYSMCPEVKDAEKKLRRIQIGASMRNTLLK